MLGRARQLCPAPSLGLTLQVIDIKRADDLPAAFHPALLAHADAVIE
jgi:hypothetical protein